MMLLFFASFSLAAATVTGILARFVEMELPESGRKMRSGGALIWSSVALAAIAIRLFIFSPSLQFPFDASLQSLLLIVLVGIVDDIFGIEWPAKLLLQFVSLIPLIISISAMYPVVSAAVSLLVVLACVIWLLLISNGANLMDGIDGYLGTWSLLTLSAMVLVAYQAGLDFPLSAVAALAIGPLALFVVYNRNPAKVFLGDTGSLSLGFMVGLFGALLFVHRPDISRLVALLVAMTLPLFEVFTTVLRRAASGRHLFQSDEDHLHHRLVRRLRGVNRAADLMAVFQMALLAFAFVIDGLQPTVAVLVFVAVWLSAAKLVAVLNRGTAATADSLVRVRSQVASTLEDK